MTMQAAQLLKRLEPAVRPNLAPAPQSKAHSPLELQSFDQLLTLASQGSVHSGRQIELGFEPSPPLAPAQLERLAAAADQAEAAGAKRALMLIDGRGFVLDIASRTLVSELSGNSAARVQPIDAAVFVAADDASQSGGGIAMPGNGLVPPGILRQLQAAPQDHPWPHHAGARKSAG